GLVTDVGRKGPQKPAIEAIADGPPFAHGLVIALVPRATVYRATLQPALRDAALPPARPRVQISSTGNTAAARRSRRYPPRRVVVTRAMARLLRSDPRPAGF